MLRLYGRSAPLSRFLLSHTVATFSHVPYKQARITTHQRKSSSWGWGWKNDDDSEAPPYASTKKLDWQDLEPRYREAWETLGWTRAMWSGEGSAPASSEKPWDKLSAAERNAARMLGYDETVWDSDDYAAPKALPPPDVAPFIFCKTQRWSGMAAKYQQAWAELGWTQSQWDGDGTPISTPWAKLTAKQRTAATTLGYTAATWDADSGDEVLPIAAGAVPYELNKTQGWESMTPEHRELWKTLGWTKGSWDDGDRKPASAFQDWADLTEKEQTAAKKLGYTQANWDEDEATLGGQLEESAYNFAQRLFGVTREPKKQQGKEISQDQKKQIPPSSDSSAAAALVPAAPKPFQLCISQSWEEMSPAHRQAWEALGWTKAMWDDEISKPITADKDWSELSTAEQTAATDLGYTEAEWNEDGEQPSTTNKGLYQLFFGNKEVPRYIRCKDQSWDQLDSEDLIAWTELGWSRASWDGDARKPWTDKLKWKWLSKTEKEAAIRLGYDENKWNMAHEPPQEEDSDEAERFKNVITNVGMGLGLLMIYLLVSAAFEDGEKKKVVEVYRCGHLWRRILKERPDWRERCEEAGLTFHSAEGIRWPDGRQDPYWTDGAAYVIDQHGEEALKEAAWRLHHMCLQAVGEVLASEELMNLFEIPVSLRDHMKASWANREPDILGRFDLMYDGVDPPKMLEYNADTPTVLIESARAQADWLQDRKKAGEFDEKTTQCNQIDEELAKAWRRVVGSTDLTVLAPLASQEEGATAAYIAKSAKNAGANATFEELRNAVFTPEQGVVNVNTGKPLGMVWKLYPYEWLVEEELGQALSTPSKRNKTRWLEPSWKMIIANKAILPLLWKMFPDHPNLLPSFFNIQDAIEYQKKVHPDADPSTHGWVAKPKFGREGLGIRYSFDSPTLEIFANQANSELEEFRAQSRVYSPELIKSLEQAGQARLGRHQSSLETERSAWTPTLTVRELPFPTLGNLVFQEYFDPPVLQGRRPVVGFWMIHGTPAGMCFREDIVATTNNDSCFVPHTVVPPPMAVEISNAKNAGINGTYTPIGRMEGHQLYEKAGTSGQSPVFLRFGENGKWEISPLPHGEEALAIGEYGYGSSPPNYVNGYFDRPFYWKEYDESQFDYALNSKMSERLEGLPVTQHRPLNAVQAQLRRDLYGDWSRATEDTSQNSHSSSGGGGGFFHNRPGGTSGHNPRPSGSWGRGFSKPHPTGSHGSTMNSGS